MGKLWITQKVSRQNAAVSNKKRLTFGVFALCLLLLCGIVVTTALLGEGIGRFSGKEADVIPLVPAQSESPADIKQETQPRLTVILPDSRADIGEKCRCMMISRPGAVKPGWICFGTAIMIR